ncbi:restriction endonuclease subunit S [Vibrio clamense]|uniref:restriction endonuclease subunit S n=1 Tax=Vibrio clamense TaxID=2910254 RepID=UPI003D23AD0F
MSKYQAYPEYKESGVEWLGEIPNHWQVIPIKYLADLNPKKSAIDHTLLNKECNFLPMEKLKLNSIALDEKRLVSDVYDGYTYFEDGDVLMAKVTPCFENKNIAVASGLVNGVGFGSSEIYVLRSNEKTDSRFLYYRLQEDSFMDIATAAMTGAGGLKRVPSDVVNGYSLGTPDGDEQTQIANFLDHETARIDTLIDKQQHLIKLLKEKRQAVISHAVTKGLNSDAPMKDSGVEWLGEVPEHWSVKKIKHFGRVVGGYAFKSGDFVESGYPVIKITNVSHLTIDLKEQSFLPQAFAEAHSEYLVKPNSLVFAMTRPIISGGVKVAIMPHLERMPLVNQRVGFLTLDCDVLSKFILFSSMSGSFVAQFTNNMTITNQPNISGEGIESVCIPVPSAFELKQIVDFLNINEEKFKMLNIAAIQQIKLLGERRAALISAAVTGKIDVRNWQAPVNQEAQQQEAS